MSKTAAKLKLKNNLTKKGLFDFLMSQITELGFQIQEVNFEKPWGGYIRIPNHQAGKFINYYFTGISLPDQINNLDLSPKFLIVEPKMRLSYQVHKRRSEFWRVLNGPAGVKLSNTDKEPEDFEIYQEGNTINIPVGTRHRLVGLDNTGIVTELWIHTDSKTPSDESDIIRIQDDFAR